jgi:membrane-associated phospholipid phosphatase
MTAAGWFYVWAHVPVAGWALVWTWYLRRDAFGLVRDAFLATQLALVAAYVAVPTAPPRLLREDGFTDTLSTLWGRELADSAHVLQSPYAAMPSGHVAFALLAGGTFAVLGDRRWLRAFGWVYPPLVVAVTIVSAHHFVLDAVGAVVLVAVCLAAVALPRSGTRRPGRLGSRACLTSKRTSRAPCGRSSVPLVTRSRRATRS